LLLRGWLVLVRLMVMTLKSRLYFSKFQLRGAWLKTAMIRL
jgi:hypothetical protein